MAGGDCEVESNGSEREDGISPAGRNPSRAEAGDDEVRPALDQSLPTSFQRLFSQTYPRAGRQRIEVCQGWKEPLGPQQGVDDDAELALPAGCDPPKPALGCCGQLQ